MDAEIQCVHGEGYTTLCYDTSGRYIMSAGVEGNIKLWDGFYDEEPTVCSVGDVVTALVYKDNYLYACTEACAVIKYGIPLLNNEGIILEFSASPYCVVASDNGSYIAAGGADFTVKVYNTVKKKYVTFRGHDAPILNLAFDPENEYLASSSCDGTVKVWDVVTHDCLATKKLFKASSDLCNSETLCRLQFEPKKGKYLIVPVQKEVKFYQRESWECLYSLTYADIVENLSLCCFSPCGFYVAAATVDGDIIVWDVKTNKVIDMRQQSVIGMIYNLTWNPSRRRELAFTDNQGQIGVYCNMLTGQPIHENELLCVGDAEGKKVGKGSVARDSKHAENNTVVKDASKNVNGSSTENDSSRMVNGSSTMNGSSKFVGDKEKGVSKKTDLSAFQKVETASAADAISVNGDQTDDDFSDNENVFDIGAIKAHYEPKIFGTEEESNEHAVVEDTKEETPRPQVVEAPTTPLQTSFQPGSAPVHLERRYMLWNSVGSIRSYSTVDDNSIEVEFHDISTHHALHINNVDGYTMASLSSEAILFAAPKDEISHSKLECMQINTWDGNNKQWFVEMSEDEDIEAITLGQGWAAVATDERMVRLFLIGGTEFDIFSLSGPIVSMAGHENKLAIAYHRGAGISGEQNLGLVLVSVHFNSHSTCKEYSLPLTSKGFLTWLGFTDEGSLCTVDTSGIVRLLDVSCSTKWIVIANTKSHTTGKSDHYFVVGLSEIQQEIRCIFCKGSRFPLLLIKPTVTVIPLKFPFCNMNVAKGQLEEEQYRLSFLHRRIASLVDRGYDLDSELAVTEKQWSLILLKMFALAVKADHDSRALNITELMPNFRLVQGAIRFATEKRRMVLAERLGEVVHKKMEEASGAVQNFETEESEGEMETERVATVGVTRPLLRPSYEINEEPQLKPNPVHIKRRLSRKGVYKSSVTTPQSSTNFVSETPDISMEAVSSNVSTEADSSGISTEAGPSGLSTDFSSNTKTNSVSNMASVSPEHDRCIPNGEVEPTTDENAPSAKNSPFVPFRTKGKAVHSGSSKAKSSGIDSMLSESTKRLSSKGTPIAPQASTKKVSRQAKLFPDKVVSSSTAKQSGFQLFLEENRERLSTEHPDANDNEIAKIAIKEFKELSAEDKAKPNLKPAKPKNATKGSSNSKRKQEASDNAESSRTDSKKSKIGSGLSAETAAKLSMFAFVKSNAE